MSIRVVLPAIALAGAGLYVQDTHQSRMAESLALFTSDVRDILIEHCVECHGGDAVRGGFDVSTREGLLAGGDNGVAVVAGNARDSPLLAYVAHRDEPFMPPKRPRLSDETIARIARWIDLGAAYDAPLVKPAPARGPMRVTDADRRYWAYAPLRAAPDGATIDAFVSAKRREQHLVPALQASKRTLIRRVSFDVTGLPPEPADIDAFLDDASPQAYERLVDRALASPHFGERWARHWLDVARFGESHGFEHDSDRMFAFHFRDFVIRAFNDDMPYDRFVRWQLAGDELAPENPLAMRATGFLAAGVHPTQITIRDAERARYEAMDDMLATTGSAMLALTVGCARCHDHKYDPIPTRDYYRMLSAFTTTVRAEVDLDLGPLEPPAASRLQTVLICSEGPHVRPMRLHTSNDQIPDFYAQTYVLDHGDPDRKAGVADPGFLQVLTRTADTTRWTGVPHDPRTSGRRAALSQWITDVDAGAGHLLARVIVNRLWQHYFGRGIVATANDFGTQGDRPTHPELLDWLAGELIRQGWRLKPIHKLILMSAAYRQDDLVSAPNMAIDPENLWLWHRRPRRLDAEALRDNTLAVAGLLDPTMFGPGTLDPASRRRSIYFTVKRSAPMPSLQIFDSPDTFSSVEARAVTTTASQALLFLNDAGVRRAAEALAARVTDGDDWIGAAYAIAYGRPPSDAERVRATAFVRLQTETRGGNRAVAVADFCSALLGSSEFIYIG